MSVLRIASVVALVALLAACATAPYQAPGKVGPPPQAGAVLRSIPLDPALEERILALDPDHVMAADVRDTLAQVPAPRIVLIHGGIYPVYLAMSSFAEFLIGMGYPEKELRRPDNVLDSFYSYSPYQDSRELAGIVAWYYERDGMRPMIIGHSQGGVQAVKVLDELAGIFGEKIDVWNPVTDESEHRTTIVDPLTGRVRPVVGLSVCYVSAVGAGGAALLLPNQWSMVHRLHTIPDSVDDFTGFSISGDLVALTFAGAKGAADYHPNGTAKVRNVFLPAQYNHVVMPATRDLARREAMRAWIDAYVPGKPGQAETMPKGDNDGALWAADVWYSIKKHWCLELQRLIHARRAALVAQ
ncbi:MAG TPA: hypothetical protein VL742_08950 [Casimicrobiaceae bacterium]|nr:hypothetical protein [Casimicrobiaceae bacterium]